jgi:hypothetical protein
LIVKNVNGTAENNCHGESWLDHWKTYSGQRANYCVVKGCGGRSEAGGHVQACGTTDDNVYIIPLCRACNDKHGQEMVIFDGVNLVSINWNITSGKKQEQEQDVSGR